MEPNANKTQPAFAEIDFAQLEFRNQYRYEVDVWIARGLIINELVRLYRRWPDKVDWFVFGLMTTIALAITAHRYFKYGTQKTPTQILLTAHSLSWRRQGFGRKTEVVEIPYAEIGEIELREDLSLPPFQPNAVPTRQVTHVIVHSLDKRKHIEVDRRLQNFNEFLVELRQRKQIAVERYQGYAQGTAIRQPERAKAVQQTIKEIQYEQLHEAKASAKRLQKILQPQPKMTTDEKQPHAYIDLTAVPDPCCTTRQRANQRNHNQSQD